MDNQEFHSGFVALIGRPNVGKSTLLNYIVGQKVAIMSNVAQTTRNKIQGIYTTKNAQIVFIDTPGVHKPKTKLGDFMERSTMSALSEVDAVLYVVAADEKRGPGDDFIINHLKDINQPIYLVVNKIDTVNPNELPDIVAQYKDALPFKDIVPVSALQGNNVNTLMNELVQELPVGPQYYPDDQLTDHPEYFVVGELIREQILHLTEKEIPHSAAVVVERMKDRTEHGKLIIEANIIVERDGQKAIVIGKGGSMLKKIGTRSRREIELLLGEKVNLKLWVRVQKNWRDNNQYLRALGYNTKDLK